jgi:maltooligosyltrehalose trehalohydrolase
MDQVHVEFNRTASWLVIRRGEIEVVVNLASDRQAIPISRPPREIIASEEGWQLRPGLIELPADSVAILPR